MTCHLPMDIHSHSKNSADAYYPAAGMCEAAIQKGLRVYAITDHYEVGGCEDPDWDFDAALRQSVSDTEACRERLQNRLQILTGIELGQPLEDLAKTEAVLKELPFDLVLGSLHSAPGRKDIYFYDPADEQYDLAAELEIYFTGLLALVRWGGFDSAAHLSYPFRYILRRERQPFNFKRYDGHLELIVKTLAEKGLGLELNTSGLTAAPSHTMPEARWIKRFKELGGEKLTLGADAHSPQYVGSGIAEAVAIAARAGFKYLCYFVRRQPQYLKIADYI